MRIQRNFKNTHKTIYVNEKKTFSFRKISDINLKEINQNWKENLLNNKSKKFWRKTKQNDVLIFYWDLPAVINRKSNLQFGDLKITLKDEKNALFLITGPFVLQIHVLVWIHNKLYNFQKMKVKLTMNLLINSLFGMN